MHYILPTEALAIQQAAIALRDIERRCELASYPIPEWSSTREGATGTREELRRLTGQVRINAQLREAVAIAEYLLHNAVVLATVHDCQSSQQASEHWHDGDWEGPQFGIKAKS